MKTTRLAILFVIPLGLMYSFLAEAANERNQPCDLDSFFRCEKDETLRHAETNHRCLAMAKDVVGVISMFICLSDEYKRHDFNDDTCRTIVLCVKGTDCVSSDGMPRTSRVVTNQGICCSRGEVQCAGHCVSLETDRANCGGCGVACRDTSCVRGGLRARQDAHRLPARARSLQWPVLPGPHE